MPVTLLCSVFFISTPVLANLGLQNQQPLIQHEGSVKDIPSIGLGLWNSKAEDARNSVMTAFDFGYKHLDSAAAYSNEKYVGEGLSSKSTPARSSYWITSKLWNTMHKPENVPKAFNQTLTDLGVDYLDLYLMHWPVAFLPNQEPGRTIIDQDTTISDTWKAMSNLVSRNRTHPEPGTTRYIGISNFSPRQIDNLLADKSPDFIRPYAHEFETHPYLQQQDFVTWHQENNIKVIAYSPLANLNPSYKDKFPELPRIIEDPFFKDLAKSKSVTAAQLILAWNIARNVTVIPKSVHAKYIQENLGAGLIKLSDADMEAIAEQDKKKRFNDPGESWGVELFEGLDGV